MLVKKGTNFKADVKKRKKRRLLCFNDRSFEISQNLNQVWLGLCWPYHWRPQKTMSSPASSQSQPLSHRSIISKYHQTPLNRIFWGCNWSLNVIRRSEHNHLLKKATSVRSGFIFFALKKRKETLKIEGTKYWCLQRGETGGLNKVKDAGWIMVAPELYAKNS